MTAAAVDADPTERIATYDGRLRELARRRTLLADELGEVQAARKAHLLDADADGIDDDAVALFRVRVRELTAELSDVDDEVKPLAAERNRLANEQAQAARAASIRAEYEQATTQAASSARRAERLTRSLIETQDQAAAALAALLDQRGKLADDAQRARDRALHDRHRLVAAAIAAGEPEPLAAVNFADALVDLVRGDPARQREYIGNVTRRGRYDRLTNLAALMPGGGS